MKEIILAHLSSYPLMTGKDIIKLLFQSEFAGEHIIKNSSQTYNHLKQECQNLNNKTYQIEPIGNNLVRFHLFNADEIELYTINQLFVCSAYHHNGSKEELIRTLKQIRQLDLPIIDLNNEIDNYLQQNCPIISHSNIYRETYKPHYRVMKVEFAYYYPILLEINKLLLVKSEIKIAIDGMSASGKSTLANILDMIYDCNIFHMDDFFLQLFQRNEKRLNSIGENIDHERFKNEVLMPLTKQQEVWYRRFDCTRMRLENNVVKMNYKNINIIEGSYSMHHDLIGYYDYKIALKISSDIQTKRIIKRNGIDMFERFKDIWIPMENDYFKFFKIYEQADIVLDNTDIEI
ncbi:uridine kinase family protein [Thomasclavelia cocleata]|uniref:uridine kinase family protein n=1 Tax=Thomasclavelia cocleata TaxID=69824 RepID=UPI00242A7FFE|nr:hypothetical protein [Thomasclavelia cocleata]